MVNDPTESSGDDHSGYAIAAMPSTAPISKKFIDLTTVDRTAVPATEAAALPLIIPAKPAASAPSSLTREQYRAFMVEAISQEDVAQRMSSDDFTGGIDALVSGIEGDIPVQRARELAAQRGVRAEIVEKTLGRYALTSDERLARLNEHGAYADGSTLRHELEDLYAQEIARAFKASDKGARFKTKRAKVDIFPISMDDGLSIYKADGQLFPGKTRWRKMAKVDSNHKGEVEIALYDERMEFTLDDIAQATRSIKETRYPALETKITRQYRILHEKAVSVKEENEKSLPAIPETGKSLRGAQQYSAIIEGKTHELFVIDSKTVVRISGSDNKWTGTLEHRVIDTGAAGHALVDRYAGFLGREPVTKEAFLSGLDGELRLDNDTGSITLHHHNKNEPAPSQDGMLDILKYSARAARAAAYLAPLTVGVVSGESNAIPGGLVMGEIIGTLDFISGLFVRVYKGESYIKPAGMIRDLSSIFEIVDTCATPFVRRYGLNPERPFKKLERWNSKAESAKQEYDHKKTKTATDEIGEIQWQIATSTNKSHIWNALTVTTHATSREHLLATLDALYRGQPRPEEPASEPRLGGHANILISA